MRHQSLNYGSSNKKKTKKHERIHILRLMISTEHDNDNNDHEKE